MKKTAIAVALAAMSATAIPAYAEIEISGNVGLFSDYRFRGISETNLKPALQGGFDLTHSSGFYIGNWNSNIEYDGGSLEMDFYGGYASEIAGVGFDVGLLRYQYPGVDLSDDGVKFNTTEAYLGLSYGPVSYKYSRTVSKSRFGIVDQKGAAYHDLSLELPLNDQITLGAHAGFTKLKGDEKDFNYKDYSVSVSYALPNSYSLGLTYYKNSFKSAAKAELDEDLAEGATKIWKNAAVISLSKSF